MSLRKLRVLIAHLPSDCASARAIAGVDGPLAHWSLHDALLGVVVDELAALRWQWEAAHIDTKKTRLRNPPESVMPHVESARRDARSSDNVIPIVSPHQLGGFINHDDVRESEHGD